MENKKTKLDTILNKAANAMMDSDTWQWPPQCSYFFYQPARPQRMSKTCGDAASQLNKNEH